jgi:xanthine/CO dehydrogenase XdhC/CoxF family maturation factor
MGLGCNGMLSILLQRLSTSDNWQPFADIITALADEHSSTVALVTASTNKTILVGSAYIRDNAGCWLHTPPQALHIPEHLPGNVTAQVADGRCEYLCWTVHPWPRLLLLGAGPDSVPLLEMTRTLGWEVTVADHRAHYIDTLPGDCASSMHVVVPGELSSDLQLERHTAVVVMSHHLDTDRKYLQELAGYQHAYIGLLGPAPRKARLLEELGLAQSDFAQRLHGPAGLAIGADTPATIALAIVSEIQSVLSTQRQALNSTPA